MLEKCHLMLMLLRLWIKKIKKLKKWVIKLSNYNKTLQEQNFN
jgi:hypothetical protein